MLNPGFGPFNLPTQEQPQQGRDHSQSEEFGRSSSSRDLLYIILGLSLCMQYVSHVVISIYMYLTSHTHRACLVSYVMYLLSMVILVTYLYFSGYLNLALVL